MMWFKKLMIIVMLLSGLIVLIATSPQVTQSQANLTQHDFAFAPDQKQMWLHLEVLSNKSIENGDLFQSELHFDLKSNEESPIIEQQRWQLIAYSPVNQDVKWVEDLALIQESSSASMNLSLQVCDAKVNQDQTQQSSCIPCYFDDGTCQVHMYLMRNHHPLLPIDMSLQVQQVYPKSHQVTVQINSSSQAIVY